MLLSRIHFSTFIFVFLVACMSTGCQEDNENPPTEVEVFECPESGELTDSLAQIFTDYAGELQQIAVGFTNGSAKQEDRIRSEELANSLTGFLHRNKLWEQYGLFEMSKGASWMQQEGYLGVIRRYLQVRDTINCTLPLGNIYATSLRYFYAASLYEAGFYGEAIDEFDAFFEIVNSIEQSKQDLLPTIFAFSRIGGANIAILDGDFDKAEIRFEEIKTFLKTHSEMETSTIQTDVNTFQSLYGSLLQAEAFFYQEQRQFNEAEQKFLESLDWFDKQMEAEPGMMKVEKGRTWSNIGELRMITGNHAGAKEAFLASQAMYDIKNGVLAGPFQVAEVSANLAIAAYQIGDTQLGNKQIAEALTVTNFGDENLSLLHPPVFENLPLDFRVLSVIYKSIACFKVLAGPNGLTSFSKDTLEVIKTYCDLAYSLVDTLGKSANLQLGEVSFLLVDSLSTLTENRLELELALLPEEIIDKSEIFKIMDQSRANWLVKGMMNGYIQTQLLIDPNLAIKISESEEELGFLTRNWLESKYESPDTENYLILKDSVDRALESFKAVMDTVRQKYPDYYSLRYNPTRATVESVQKELLGPQETFLEFFIGRHNIYSYLITPDTSAMFVVEKPEGFNAMVQTVNNIQITNGVVEAERMQEFSQVAPLLYDLLLKAPLDYLLASGEKWYLTVLPHDVLVNLNMGTLLTNPIPSELSNLYSQWPYLVKDERFTLSYELSASLAQTQFGLERKRGKGSVWFGNNAKDLEGFNTDANSLATLYGGDFLIGGENDFKQVAGNYQLIHIGSHGRANLPDLAEPGLLFAELSDTDEDQVLTLSEIYPLKLSADLAVIQSCESGLGISHETEGMLSIGRAFRYVGVPAVITSLWEIPSKETSMITTEMYANMDQGMRPDEALQKAQVAFLESANGTALGMPAYWAGMICQGEMVPGLPTGEKTTWWLWLGLFVVLSAVLWLWIGWKRSR